MKYRFAYGSDSVELDLENVDFSVLKGNSVAPIGDIQKALYSSLESPVSSLPLKEIACRGMKIALVVSDMSRFWMRQDMVIPHVVSYLKDTCGVLLSDIAIIVANGTHAGGSEEDLKKLVTEEVFSLVKVINHDASSSDNQFIGKTSYNTEVFINPTAASADLVICLGAATHHVMAGFGGGRKSIVPGIAGLCTIAQNHSLCLDKKVFKSNPLIGNGVLEGNPMNEDICQAAAFVKNLFMINLVMNADMKLCFINSGHYLKSWLEACRLVDSIYSIDIPKKADVIIASCGGYPKDMSLYQGTKAIDNIELCLKPGGTLVLFIEARDGGGPEEYFGWIKNVLDGTQEKRLRSAFTVAGYIFLLNMEQAQRYDIRLVTSIKPEILEPMGIKAFNNPNYVLEGINFNNKTVYVIPNGSTVIPKEAGL